MSNKKLCEVFGGENALQYNALMTALLEASEAENTKDNGKVYNFLDLPKTSLILELTQALNKIGYKIVKI